MWFWKLCLYRGSFDNSSPSRLQTSYCRCVGPVSIFVQFGKTSRGIIWEFETDLLSPIVSPLPENLIFVLGTVIVSGFAEPRWNATSIAKVNNGWSWKWSACQVYPLGPISNVSYSKIKTGVLHGMWSNRVPPVLVTEGIGLLPPHHSDGVNLRRYVRMMRPDPMAQRDMNKQTNKQARIAIVALQHCREIAI